MATATDHRSSIPPHAASDLAFITGTTVLNDEDAYCSAHFAIWPKDQSRVIHIMRALDMTGYELDLTSAIDAHDGPHIVLAYKLPGHNLAVSLYVGVEA